MSLGVRVVLILSMVAALSMGFYLGIQHWFIVPSFLALERREAEEHMERCLHALRREIYHLDVFCDDWAAWDDTYEYVANPNRAYEEANLASTTFMDNRLSSIHIIDLSGRVVWGKVYDLETEEPIQVAELSCVRWAATRALLTHKDEDSSVTGVMMTEKGPMLVSSRPIRTSLNAGPVCGAMIMGRFVDEVMVNTLAEQTLMKIGIWPLETGWLPPEQSATWVKMREASAHFHDVVDDSLLRVYAAFPGIQHKPALLVRVDVDRDTLAHGRMSMALAWNSVVVCSLIVLLVLLILLRKTVTDPVARVTRHVKRLGDSGGLSLLEPSWRRDDIGTLEREFNRMVRRLRQENSEREKAEAALRESESRIRAVVEDAPDGIITFGQDGVIESANPAAACMFGYSPGELKGQSVGCVVPDLAGAAEDAGTACAPREGLGTRKDGSRLPIQVSTSEVHLPTGRLFTAIVCDITELKEIQKEMRRVEGLAAIGEMGAAMAHEVRNPLAGISGAIQVIRASMKRDDERRGILAEVMDQVARLDAIVNRLLLFAKSWAPEYEHCDLRELVERISGEAKTQEPWKGIQFAFDGAPVLHARVDPSLVEQVVWNLLRNAGEAIERTDVDKTPDHETQPGIRWHFEEGAGTARLTLTDTGTGMPPEVEQKAFDPFFTTKTYGTGLGLAICRKIVESHGGTIQVSSIQGAGAEAVLEFPKGD